MTDRIMGWLDESQQLANQATEGPWAWSDAAHGSPTNGPTHHAVRARGGMVAETDYDVRGALNAEFIIAARTDVVQLEAALRGVLDLHRPEAFHDEPSMHFCRTCQVTSGVWPCPTVRAIADALGVETEGGE